MFGKTGHFCHLEVAVTFIIRSVQGIHNQHTIIYMTRNTTDNEYDIDDDIEREQVVLEHLRNAEHSRENPIESMCPQRLS